MADTAKRGVDMKISAKDRMARLIAAIPWIVAQDGASVDDIAERFDYPRDLLLGDLQDVVFFVGVPPYTPDTLIEVTIDDDMVWISYADWFSRPMRLSGAEILSLLAAGETALAFDTQDEAGALARGLTKLRLSTGSDADTIDVQLGVGSTEALPILRAAAGASTCVDISYYSFGRDARTERRIEPVRFFMDAGNWYVGGYCHLAEAERVFRVDRIESIEHTDSPFSQPPSGSDETFAMADAPRVIIELPKSRERLLDGQPIDDRVEHDRHVVVTVPVASERWLTQMLVRLGPDARLLEHPEDATSQEISVDLAGTVNEILGRYDI